MSFRGTSTATNAMDDMKMNLVPFTLVDDLPGVRPAKVFVHNGFQRVRSNPLVCAVVSS